MSNLSVSESIYRVSCTAVFHACSCCFSSWNQFVPTEYTSFTVGLVIRYRLTGGTKVYENGRVDCELIRRHSRSKPGFCDKGN